MPVNSGIVPWTAMVDNAVNAQKYIPHKIGNLIRNVCVQDVRIRRENKQFTVET